MRRLIFTIGGLVILAGCGHVPGVQVTAGDYKLYVAASTSSSQQLSVIDSRSHAVERNLPLGTASPDWTHLYTVKGCPGCTQGDSLVDIDPLTGNVLHTVKLPGFYQLPQANSSGIPGGLSPNGHWLVLESFDGAANKLPATSQLLVVDTHYVVKPQRIDLTGYFQFDAVNNSGNRVYLIQYISNTDYHVRFFDVPAGVLDPNIVFDKADGSAAMAGLRLSGVASPDGQWLYSVYVRPDKSAFIHMLSLENPIAFCVDLPGAGYSSNPDEFHWSLALSPDGSHLYAANGPMGIVADINTLSNGTPGIARKVHIANGQSASILAQDVQAKEFGSNAAAVSPDGRTLVIAGKNGLVWMDTASLKAQGRQLADWTIWSLGMSPDGTTVYAVNDAGMIAELPMSGAHSPTTFGGAPGQPLALIRVAAV